MFLKLNLAFAKREDLEEAGSVSQQLYRDANGNLMPGVTEEFLVMRMSENGFAVLDVRQLISQLKVDYFKSVFTPKFKRYLEEFQDDLERCQLGRLRTGTVFVIPLDDDGYAAGVVKLTVGHSDPAIPEERRISRQIHVIMYDGRDVHPDVESNPSVLLQEVFVLGRISAAGLTSWDRRVFLDKLSRLLIEKGLDV